MTEWNRRYTSLQFDWLYFIGLFECNMYSANICPVFYVENKNSKMILQVFFMYFGSSNYTKQILNKTDWENTLPYF